MGKKQCAGKKQNINIEKKFRDFLDDCSLCSRLGGRDSHYAGKVYGPKLGHLTWDEWPLQDVVEVIQCSCPNVSRKTIREVTWRAMVDLFERAIERGDKLDDSYDTILPVVDRGSIIRDKAVKLVEDLRARVRLYDCLVPVDGVHLEPRELEMGEVTLYSNDYGPLPGVVEKWRETRKQWAGEIEESFGQDECREPTCYAVVRIEGEFRWARDQAVRKVQDMIHVIRLFLASSRDRKFYKKIGLVGQPSILQDQLVVCIDCETQEEEIPGGALLHKSPPRRPCGITAEHVRNWRGHGFDKITGIFQSLNSEDIGSRIKRSVTWYSKGVAVDNSDEQFVALAIAVESLLIGRGESNPQASWGSITQRIADRAAFLLGKNVNERIKIAKSAKDLYRKRSGIVHSGESVSPADVLEMEHLVQAAIIRFVQQDFNTWTDFISWETGQRYSVPGDDEDKRDIDSVVAGDDD